MKKVIVEYDNDVVSTYDIVLFRSYKKGKKEVLQQDLPELINHFSVRSYKFVEPTRKRSIGEGTSSTYIPKNKKENISMPIEIADEIVMFAKGDGAGFTKEIVDKWNQYLNFNLHTKFERYGFTGSSRLNTIFKI
tara:strand:- start:1148 stop:1552 length:405 start_codon:yes stop_codon:yes gene_type:complete